MGRGSRGPSMLSEIGGRVDLRRCVIALECALERRPAVHRISGVGFLTAGCAGVVHQVIILLDGLLPSPDPPSDKGQTAENDCAADANHDTNHDISGLGRHASLRATLTAAGQSGCLCHCGLGSVCCLLPVVAGSSNDSRGGDNIYALAGRTRTAGRRGRNWRSVGAGLRTAGRACRRRAAWGGSWCRCGRVGGRCGGTRRGRGTRCYSWR
jgi:hypothetical protein